MRALQSISAAVLSLTLCATVGAQDGSGSRDPNWFKKVLAREAEPLQEQVLASEAGGFTTRVAARVASPPKAAGKGYYVQLDLGTDVPMQCWIYPKGHDIASALRTYSDRVFESIARNQGTVDLKEIQRIDAGAFGPYPYLALDWLYRVTSARGSFSGQIKLIAGYKLNASAHCLHNEAGYLRTFTKAFYGLLANLEVEGNARAPYYQEVMAVSMNGLRMGGAHLTMTRDKDGNTRVGERTFFLAPARDETVTADDSNQIQWSTPNGRLTRMVDKSGSNGKQNRLLALDQKADGGWQVSGTYKSNKLQRSLKPQVLPSALGQMLLLSQFVAEAQPGDKKAYWEWSPSTDPAQFSPVNIEVTGRTTNGVAARMQMEGELIDVIVDVNGSLKSAILDMGGASLGLQRVYIEGSLDARSGAEAPAPAPPPADDQFQVVKGDPQDPNWFDKLLAREAEPLPERPVATEDGVLETRVAAEIMSAPQIMEGDYFLQLDLGGDAPMECWLYPEGHDMAASQRAFSEALFEHIGETQGELQMKAIQRIDAGVFGAHPYLALDWLYRVQSSQGPLAGQLKLLTAHNRGASAHCFHNEAGYAKTFERIFRGLVDNLEVANASPEPYFELVQSISMNDLKLGVARIAFVPTESGNTRITEVSTAVLPISTEAVAARDTYNVQISSPRGRLLKEVDIASQDGELTTQLTLDATEDGGWTVSGTYDSKDFSATPEPKGLLSGLGQRWMFREFLASASPGDETTYWEWSSNPDPGVFTENRIQVGERTEDGIAAHFVLGDSEVQGILDSDATIKSATIQVNGVELQLERLYVAGELPSR